MPLPSNDPAIDGIAERLRIVMSHQPSALLDELAAVLGVDHDRLRRLIKQPHETIDVAFLIDTVAAVVHSFAVDPQWLLTGRYDPSIHRQALMLGDDRSPRGARALRDYVAEQYRRLRDSTLALLRGVRLSRTHARP